MPASDSLYRLRLDLAQLRREFDTYTNDARGPQQRRDLDRLRREFDQFCGKYGPIIDAMQQADQVSRALAEAARTTQAAARDANRIRLSKRQFAVACAVAIVPALNLILQLVHAATNWGN